MASTLTIVAIVVLLLLAFTIARQIFSSSSSSSYSLADPEDAPSNTPSPLLAETREKEDAIFDYLTPLSSVSFPSSSDMYSPFRAASSSFQVGGAKKPDIKDSFKKLGANIKKSAQKTGDKLKKVEKKLEKKAEKTPLGRKAVGGLKKGDAAIKKGEAALKKANTAATNARHTVHAAIKIGDTIQIKGQTRCSRGVCNLLNVGRDIHLSNYEVPKGSQLVVNVTSEDSTAKMVKYGAPVKFTIGDGHELGYDDSHDMVEMQEAGKGTPFIFTSSDSSRVSVKTSTVLFLKTAETTPRYLAWHKIDGKNVLTLVKQASLASHWVVTH